MPGLPVPSEKPAEKPAEKPTAQMELRLWKDTTGEYELLGQFVGYWDGKVRIRSADGRSYRVALERLSWADQIFVHTQLARLATR